MSAGFGPGHVRGSHDHSLIDDTMEPSTSTVLPALKAIHDPASSNETRQAALKHLEAVKDSPEAPQHGFDLANDRQQAPMVRHFGLSLLETSIRHRWYDLPIGQRQIIKEWCIRLVMDVQEQDPLFLQNKVSQVWVELAKKCWALDWFDMDAYLVQLWDRGLSARQLVFSVLETLSEDAFYREDTAAALRGNELNTALVEIFTSAKDHDGGIKIDAEVYRLRAGEEGWLERVGRFLDTSMSGSLQEEKLRATVIKALATLRSAFTWIMPSAIISTGCLASVFRTFAGDYPDVLLATTEVLHALYARSHFETEEFQKLVKPIYQPENVELLNKLYQTSLVDCHEVSTEDVKYALSKKFSETIAFLFGHAEHRASFLIKDVDISPFLGLSLDVLRHQSLVVSIPVLHSWQKLWASEILSDSASVWSKVGSLLETASHRIIRYEQFPEDSLDPVIVFLNEDIDTIPERHAFLGNYRRFAFQIIESITERRPREAISHILAQTDSALDQWQSYDRSFSPSNFGGRSEQLLEFDARCTVVEAALRGYNKWVATRGKQPQNDEEERATLETSLEEWGTGLLAQRIFRRPDFEQRMIKLAIELSTRGLPESQSFSLKVLQHLLSALPKDDTPFKTYSEAVKELHVFGTNEMRRLTMRNADYFATFYDQIEEKVRDMSANWNMDEKPLAELQAVLFVIFQRASNVDPEIRRDRLERFVQPVRDSWQDTALQQALSSFEGFCNFLGFDQIAPYLQSIGAHHVQDWALLPVNEEGVQIQNDLNIRFARLPFRNTKSLLAASTEKMKRDTPSFEIATQLWRPCFPAILPNVLRLVTYAHQFSDRSTWSSLPPEMQTITDRVLRDRFWQAGISSGSKEDFYAKITSTKSTLEGFGSSVRGKLRMVRESCYSILYCMSRLGDVLYSFPGLSEPLAEALYGRSSSLTSHQFTVLLNMTRHLVDQCPIDQRREFLSPILSTLYVQLDAKLTSAWSSLDERKIDGSADQSALGEEMKEESILRGLTYHAVMLVTSLLDPQHAAENGPITNGTTKDESQQSLLSSRSFVLSSTTILEPILMFSGHAIRIRDTRSCGVITRVLQSVVPYFAQPPQNEAQAQTAQVVREYLSREVLQAAITSLNDPYFVDLQKDLAVLIARIWLYYGIWPSPTSPQDPTPLSTTPRSVLCSLPGLHPEKVDNCAQLLGRESNHRHQRALVLSLLEDLRGVSVSELGKIKPTVNSRQARRSAKEQYSSNMDGTNGKPPPLTAEDGEDGADLSGIKEIFG